MGAVKDIPALQSKTLKEWLYTEDQGLLPPEDIYINSSHTEIATFAWNAPSGDEYVMLREKFDGVHSATSWKNGPIAARVKQLVDEQMKNPERQQPPNDLANFCMAKLMLENHRTQKDKTILAAYFESGTGKQGKNKGKVFGTRWFKALDELWKDRSLWPAIRVEYAQASENVLDAMKTIERSYARSSKTPFEAHDRDEIAGSDPAILRPVTRKVIYLAVDAKIKVLLFRWPGAMVQMFGKGFTKKAAEQVKSFAEYDPCPAPEPHRHAMTPHWLRQNPRFDKKREPKEVCGVYHVGIDDTMAHPKEGIHEKSDFLGGDANIQRIRGELMEGVLHGFTEASMFVQGILDPELLKKQQAAMREFPELKDPTTFTHPAEAFSTGAILINPKTESHVDSSDLIGGLAGMCPVGEFQSEWNLVATYVAPSLTCFRGRPLLRGPWCQVVLRRWRPWNDKRP